MGQLDGEKILIGPSSFSATDPGPLELLMSTGAEVIDNPFKRRLTKAELLELLSGGITGIIAGLEPFDKEVLNYSKALKVVSRCGSGMSNVDQKAAQEADILVRYTPDAPVDSVAELSLGAMLSLLRMIPVMNSELHANKWTKKIGALLSEKTVLIIGFGRIGRRLSELLKPFRAKILVVDPFFPENTQDVENVSLEEGLSRADIISVHSSGEGCIIGEKEMGYIKPGALLLNAARGALINEDVLIKALDSKQIEAAWLDVFDEEPYNGPLIDYPQVILTPHVGSYTRECRKRMETESVNNLIEAFKKKRK